MAKKRVLKKINRSVNNRGTGTGYKNNNVKANIDKTQEKSI